MNQPDDEDCDLDEDGDEDLDFDDEDSLSEEDDCSTIDDKTDLDESTQDSEDSQEARDILEQGGGGEEEDLWMLSGWGNHNPGVGSGSGQCRGFSSAIWGTAPMHICMCQCTQLRHWIF